MFKKVHSPNLQLIIFIGLLQVLMQLNIWEPAYCTNKATLCHPEIVTFSSLKDLLVFDKKNFFM